MSASIIIAASAALISAGSVCPSNNFADFAIAFTNSVDIQRLWTKDSVKIVHRSFAETSSDEDPDVEEIVSMTESKTLSFPLLPTFRELTSTMHSSVRIGSERITRHMGEGAWTRSYVFDKTSDGCWMLSSIEEDSF